MRTLRLSLLAALCAVTVIGPLVRPAAAQPAPAPDPAKIEEAKKHFAKGKQLYDGGDKKGAVEEFKEAYKLTRNPLLLYNIGLTYDELKDKPLALHYYEKFLSDAPNDARTAGNRTLSADRVKALKKEIAEEEALAAATAAETARLEAEASAQAAAEAEAKKAQGVHEFTHVVVEEAPPGKPLDIVAKIPVDAQWLLTVYHRRAGEDAFQSVRMRPRYEEMVGRVPAESVGGNSLQYYIEVKDRKGKLVASSGQASSPNIVYLDPQAKPHYYADLAGGSGSMVGEGDEEPIDVVPGPVVVDERPGWRFWAKWGATGVAVGGLTLGVISYVTASNYSATLEAEADDSTDPARCPSPPCIAYSAWQKSLEADGKQWETWTNVGLGVGAVAAIGAGVLWYLDLRDMRKEAPPAARPATGEESEESVSLPGRRALRFSGIPIVGEDFVGGAALIEF